MPVGIPFLLDAFQETAGDAQVRGRAGRRGQGSGVIRAKDGQLYLFPRLVARGNHSRIGIARVLFDASGDPMGVERMGLALEPEADYELSEHGGGCEDPRISYVEPLQHYIMTYTAFPRRGPRIAIAISDDLLHWRRLGLAMFHPYVGIAFDWRGQRRRQRLSARWIECAFHLVRVAGPRLHHRTIRVSFNVDGCCASELD